MQDCHFCLVITRNVCRLQEQNDQNEFEHLNKFQFRIIEKRKERTINQSILKPDKTFHITLHTNPSCV